MEQQLVGGKKRERIGFGRNTALWVREAERMLGEREAEVPRGGRGGGVGE